MQQQLLTKIREHTAVVAVVGLGYVGLLLRLRSGQALAVAFAEQGFPVVGIDVDGGKVAALHQRVVKKIPPRILRLPLRLRSGQGSGQVARIDTKRKS